jgi:hypothetical protein
MTTAIEELERLGVEPSASMLASFDPASNVVVIRSLITLSVVHSLTCDASAADNNAPPLAPPPPAKRGRRPAAAKASAASSGKQKEVDDNVAGEQLQQRVVLPAMAKVSLSTTVRLTSDNTADLFFFSFYFYFIILIY